MVIFYNPVGDIVRRILAVGKAIGEYLCAVYLVRIQRLSDHIGDHDDPDIQDLKRVIFCGLRFIPVVCIVIPGVPMTWPIGWYGIPFIQFLISLV